MAMPMARRKKRSVSKRAEQPIDRLAAWIREHKHDPIDVAHELQRLHRPRPVQFILQSVFVSEAIEA
jgi:hypothetical protein